MASPQYQVVNGPSREELFDSARLAREVRPLVFEWIDPTDERQQSRVILTNVGIPIDQDQRGIVWPLKGYDLELSGDNSVSLVYNTKNRTGTIQFGVTDEAETARIVSALHDQLVPTEDFFVQVTTSTPESTSTCYVGPFESPEARAEFIQTWRKAFEKSEVEWAAVALAECNALPEQTSAIRPEDFRGFVKFDG